MNPADAAYLKKKLKGLSDRVARAMYRRNPRASAGAAGATTLRRAYVLSSPPAAASMTMALDSSDGDQVTVQFNIISPISNYRLNEAVPRLSVGDYVYVHYEAGAWRCVQSFMDSGEC